MKYTRLQRDAIKSHWSYYAAFRFMSDGSVQVKQRKDGAWGVLYSHRDAQRHLEAIGMWKEQK